MTALVPDPFEVMIRKAGEGWMLDWFTPKEKAVSFFREKIIEADARAKAMLGGTQPRITVEKLIEEHQSNPHRVKAFLQALWSVRTLDMLVMVWRVLEGMEIAEVELQYFAKEKFRMRVVLLSPYGEPREEYASSDIDDAALLRHFGITKTDEKPLFDGFYALKR